MTPARAIHALALAGVLGAAASIACGATPPGMDRELFERAFGNSAARADGTAPAQLDLPVLVDGREVGVVPARVDGAELRVQRAALLRVLAPLVRTARLAALQADDRRADLTPADLAKAGLGARYASAQLALVIDIPLALRNPRQLSLGTLPAAPLADAIRPGALSAYLNWRIAAARFSPDQGTPRDFNRLALEGVVNARGWVFETGASLFAATSQSTRWRRDNTRLVHDWQAQAVRFTAGDLVPAGSGLRQPVPVFGLGAERRFTINRALGVRPSPRQPLTLATGGQAEVFVNGRLVSTLHLDPGVYQLSDFPVASGANDVVVRVREAGGGEQVARFDFFYESSLLEVGVAEFSIALGAPLDFDASGKRRYRHDDQLLQAGGRIGLAPFLTGGVGLQATSDARLLTADLTTASRIGNTFAEWGQSGGTGLSAAHALRISHRIERQPGTFEGSSDALIVQWARQQPGFVVPGTAALTGVTGVSGVSGGVGLATALAPALANRANHELGARYTRAVTERASVALSVQERRAATLPAPLRSAAFTWYQRVSRALSGELALTRTRGGVTGDDTSLVLTVHWLADGIPTKAAPVAASGAGSAAGPAAAATMPPYAPAAPLFAEGASLFGNAQFEAGRQAHDLNYEAGDANTLVRAGGAVEHRGDGSLVAGRFLLRTPRFEATANVWQARGAGGYRNTDLSLGAALVWVDGQAGLASPVVDSFALIAPHARLGARRVLVDPGPEGRAGAASDWAGSPVLANLTSYQPRELALEVEDLPLSWDIGNARPRLLPTYRSGLVVPIGSAGTTTVTGRMVGPTPAGRSGVAEAAGAASANATADARATRAYQTAILRRATPPLELPLFTNRKGDFRIDGVPPGHYELLTADGTGGAPARVLARVEVRADQEGTIDLGEVLVPEEP